MANNFEKALPDQDWDDILELVTNFQMKKNLFKRLHVNIHLKNFFPRVKEALKEIFDKRSYKSLVTWPHCTDNTSKI
ncbi:MAG: hypothetical protein CM15mP73_0720 [Hyphomicrobiales bacterium]|nr:MAG: hypothetical protein CM15mP73_0720 [Hyphomicrobiales bacterium]